MFLLGDKTFWGQRPTRSQVLLTVVQLCILCSRPSLFFFVKFSTDGVVQSPKIVCFFVTSDINRGSVIAVQLYI